MKAVISRFVVQAGMLLFCFLPFSVNAQEQCVMQLWYDQPARFFEESLPIGNGKIGALLYGGADIDSLYLNDITLWTGQPVDRKLCART